MSYSPLGADEEDRPCKRNAECLTNEECLWGTCESWKGSLCWFDYECPTGYDCLAGECSRVDSRLACEDEGGEYCFKHGTCTDPCPEDTPMDPSTCQCAPFPWDEPPPGDDPPPGEKPGGGGGDPPAGSSESTMLVPVVIGFAAVLGLFVASKKGWL